MRVYGAREKCFCRERNEKVKFELCLNYIQKTQLDGSKYFVEICRALNLDRNETVEVQSRFVNSKTHLDGSRISLKAIERTERSEIWLDGSKKLSRIYRGETQNFRWIKNLLRSIEKRERRLTRNESVEIYREKRKKARQK